MMQPLPKTPPAIQAGRAFDSRDNRRHGSPQRPTAIEIYERKRQIRRALLDRDTIALVVGAVLLVLTLTFFMVAAIFSVVVPSLLSYTFLMILGYFFGQAAKAR